MLKAAPGKTKKLLIDMSKVTYISSAGLRVLMIAAKGCRKQDGKVVLAGLQPTVSEVFKIGRFDKVFTVFETVHAGAGCALPRGCRRLQRQISRSCHPL